MKTIRELLTPGPESDEMRAVKRRMFEQRVRDYLRAGSGRAGFLESADRFLKTLPLKPATETDAERAMRIAIQRGNR